VKEAENIKTCQRFEILDCLADVEFSSHADVVLPFDWVNLDVSSNDRRFNFALNYSFAILISIKLLDGPEGLTNHVVPQLIIFTVRDVVPRYVLRHRSIQTRLTLGRNPFDIRQFSKINLQVLIFIQFLRAPGRLAIQSSLRGIESTAV